MMLRTYKKLLGTPHNEIINQQEVTIFQKISKITVGEESKEKLDTIVLLPLGDKSALHFAFLATDKEEYKFSLQLFSTLTIKK